jgi:hypothetical protein
MESSMNGRRHSARLMEKEDMAPPSLSTTNGYYANSNGTSSKTAPNGSVKGRQTDGKGTVAKKRKAGELALWDGRKECVSSRKGC